MKKICLFSLIPLICFSFLTCKNEDSVKKSQNAEQILTYSEKSEYKERNSLKLSVNNQNLVDYDSLHKFFTPDYTPEYPDAFFTEINSNSKNHCYRFFLWNL